MSANLEDPAVAIGLEKVNPYLILKKDSTKECANHQTIALISHASKIMLKILYARLQYYLNQELPSVQVGFIKGRGTKDQIANICRITEKARKFQKNIYHCLIDYAKTFDYVDHNKLWKALKRGRKYQTILPVSWENCMWVKKQQLDCCMEQLIGSRLRKEYDRAVCCCSVCLTCMLSTSWEMPD